MKGIKIEVYANIEIDGSDYPAIVCAAVYPAENGENSEPRQEMRIELDDVTFLGRTYFSPQKSLSFENYNRCILAIQNEIDKILEK